MHKYAYTYIYTCIYMHTNTYTDAHAYTYIHACLYTYTRKHIYTQTQHVHIHASKHAWNDGAAATARAADADARSSALLLITGPASLAEQIGPEHGCSLLLLVPLLWARITACGRWRWLVPSLSLHSTWARRPAGPLPHARTGRHTAGLSWRGSIRWSIPIYSKPQ